MDTPKETINDASAPSSEEGANVLGESDNIAENPNAAGGGNSAIMDTSKIQKNNLLIIFAILALGAIIIVYYISTRPKKQQDNKGLPFATDNKPTKEADIPMPTISASYRPDTAIAVAAPTPPPPPPQPVAPKEVAPSAPPTLKLPEAPKELPPPLEKNDLKAQEEAAKSNKEKSSIMLTNASAQTPSGGNAAAGAGAHNSPISATTASGDFAPEFTSAGAVKVTMVGDMSITITQGKILDAVLETPINTSNAGPIRALISRDVYSEKGSNVLIPKGSRLVGTLKSGYSPGNTRVMIDWTRIIMPSGYDIAITGSPAVSPIGMLGIEGFVDRKLLETLGTSALLSVINIGMAKIIESKFNIKPATTTDMTSNTGTIKTTSSLTPTQQAAQTELQNLSNATEDWVKQNFVPTPYIVIDQGTRVKVFVNQDIKFPKNSTSNISFIK